MLWGHPHRPGQHGTHSPAEPISIHGAGGSASSEKGARHWGARRRRRGRRGATGTLTRPRGGVATASSQRARSESSRQEEPPSGGSTPLGERKEKREARRGERGAELASPAAADARAAPPRLRRRGRPPSGPSPEARWRQFRCPGSPDVQASPLRPKPCGRDVGADAAGAGDAGEVWGEGG